MEEVAIAQGVIALKGCRARVFGITYKRMTYEGQVASYLVSSACID